MTNKELAAAIRKGAAMRPQANGLYFDWGDDGIRGSCAIGAACEGLGLCTPDSWRAQVTEKLASEIGFGLSAEIYRKNDSGMTREQIADWLESLDMEKPKDKQSFADFMETVQSKDAMLPTGPIKVTA